MLLASRGTSTATSPRTAGKRPSVTELERLGEEIAELAAHLHAATYHLLVRLREFDEREGWDGFLSCAHWLTWRTGIAPGAAREKVRVARALAALPRLAAAMARGELSFSKVRALTRIATSENEEEMLGLARHGTAAQVETIVRAWRRIDRQEESLHEQRRHEGRYLRVQLDEDGAYVIRGRLDPEVGALFERALEAAVQTLYDQVPTGAKAGASVPTAEQRRADALGLLVEHALSNAATTTEAAAPALPLRRANRVQVVLHVEGDALRADGDSGQAVLAGGVRVSAETSRRLACTASRVVMAHDGTGRVLDVGRRTRIIPTAIRRALEHRDRHCRFPACTNRITDAHHVRHWADGGPTSLENLVLLCPRHHRAVHEDGHRVVPTIDGAFVFLRPDGRPLTESPPPPVVEPHTLEGDALRRLTPEVVVGAHVPWSGGDRLDLDWAMYMMYTPRRQSA